MRRRVRVNKSKINLNRAKSVTFVFENCDVAEVPFRYIDTFAIDGLCDYITYSKNNGTSYSKICNSIYIGFDKSVDSVDYNSFGNSEWNTKVIDRIRSWNDITSVEIHFADRKPVEIIVPYTDGVMVENLHQKVVDYGEYGYVLLIDKDNVNDKEKE